MDLETENRLAALLMEEARRLRLEADKEGVQVYLHQPNIRSRPNSRFLTATVLGVQQANRAVEVGEMWRAREKELELEAKQKSGTKDKSTMSVGRQHRNLIKSSSSSRHIPTNRGPAVSSSSSKQGHEDCNSDDDGGLRDDEIEQFLHSRAKRGRGAIGSRMDEPGPYLSSSVDHDGLPLSKPDVRVKEEWEHRVLGPEKPSFLRTHELLEDDSYIMAKTDDSCTAKKRHSKEKKRSEEKKSRKTKGTEKRSKHHHKSRRRE